MRFLRAQGATEYLVLLAVVLVIALVSIALLGFFPGMASDAQVTQSEMYWKSATPIAVVETYAVCQGAGNWTYPKIRVRNTGTVPIRITKILGAGNKYLNATWYGSGCSSIANDYYLAPGEEKVFGSPRVITFMLPPYPNTCQYLDAASSVCQNSTNSPGLTIMKDFGFEYVTYVDNVEITKKQIGSAPLIIRCG